MHQDFATGDLLSGGRAEIIVGRGAFTESFAHYLASHSRGRFRVSRDAYEQAAGPRGPLYVGSPQEIIDKALAQHELFGHSRILGQMDIGALPYAALSRSVELFASEVAPALRAASPLVGAPEPDPPRSGFAISSGRPRSPIHRIDRDVWGGRSPSILHLPKTASPQWVCWPPDRARTWHRT